jgi:hypothetical protein
MVEHDKGPEQDTIEEEALEFEGTSSDQLDNTLSLISV